MEKNYNDMYNANFSELKGKTLEAISAIVGDDTAQFLCVDGSKYQMHYYQDCCASCRIEDICGDLTDLIGSPILLAEEVSSREPSFEEAAERAADKARAEAKGEYYWAEDSETWTFYKLATIKGAVTFRWYGSSNGYYSEDVTFERVP